MSHISTYKWANAIMSKKKESIPISPRLLWMGHVTRMSPCEWVMSHAWTRNVSHPHETGFLWTSHVTQCREPRECRIRIFAGLFRKRDLQTGLFCPKDMSRMNVSWHTWMRHVFLHFAFTCECVLGLCGLCHACMTHAQESCHCNTLQHTATHCNTLQHTATHCNSLQLTATHYNSLQLTATHCNSLQHTATHCNTLQHTATHCECRASVHTRRV